MAKQVWGIALVSILIWVGAILGLASSVMALFLGSALTSFGLSIGIADFSAMFLSFAFFGIIMAILYILLGIFLWKHNAYAWWITFILVVLSLISIIPGFLAISPIVFIGLVLPIIELVALTNNDSMKACKVKLMDWKGW